jgi:hypothetical protein
MRYTIDEIPSDLLKDSRGVYGYMPKEGSPFSKERWGVDWGNVKQVQEAQVTRVQYHGDIFNERQVISTMREA